MKLRFRWLTLFVLRSVRGAERLRRAKRLRPGKSKTSTLATTPATHVSGKLVLDNESGATWTCHFNPFNPAVSGTSVGFVYEPLEFVDILKGGAVTPWLAASSNWSSDFKTLTFTIRNGVTWSDGQPFSAKDVVYTFNAMKHDKAIDLNAIWKADGGPLTSVTHVRLNPGRVHVRLAGPVVLLLRGRPDADHPPAHLVLTEPEQARGPLPIPTRWGPVRTRSQRAWRTTSSTSPTPTTGRANPGTRCPQIARGGLSGLPQQHAGQPVPVPGPGPVGLSSTSPASSRSTSRRTQHTGTTTSRRSLNVSLFPNLTNSLLGQLAVRKAISLAINRPVVAARRRERLPERGQPGPAWCCRPSRAGMTARCPRRPTAPPGPNTCSARRASPRGQTGSTRRGGRPLSFTIKTVSGFTDWDDSLAIITQELKAVGISVTAQDENSGTYTSDLSSGNFQLAYAGSGGPYPSAGPSPYYELRGVLFSGNIGTTNYSRFKSSSTDALFDEYPAASPSKQLTIMHADRGGDGAARCRSSRSPRQPTGSSTRHHHHRRLAQCEQTRTASPRRGTCRTTSWSCSPPSGASRPARLSFRSHRGASIRNALHRPQAGAVPPDALGGPDAQAHHPPAHAGGRF